MKKNNLKKEILEVLNELPKEPGHLISSYLLDVEGIIQKVKELRVKKALKELESKGLVEWDERAKGWRIKKSAIKEK